MLVRQHRLTAQGWDWRQIFGYLPYPETVKGEGERWVTTLLF